MNRKNFWDFESLLERCTAMTDDDYSDKHARNCLSSDGQTAPTQRVSAPPPAPNASGPRQQPVALRVQSPSAFGEVPFVTAAERVAAIEAAGRVTAAWIQKADGSVTSSDVLVQIAKFKAALLLQEQ